jgi:hypothetical protein
MEFLPTGNYDAAVIRLNLLVEETTSMRKHQREQDRTCQPGSVSSAFSKKPS